MGAVVRHRGPRSPALTAALGCAEPRWATQPALALDSVVHLAAGETVTALCTIGRIAFETPSPATEYDADAVSREAASGRETTSAGFRPYWSANIHLLTLPRRERVSNLFPLLGVGVDKARVCSWYAIPPSPADHADLAVAFGSFG